MALYVEFAIGTHVHATRDGILAAVAALQLAENPLEEVLGEGTDEAGHFSTWREFLSVSVNIAAEFTPQLRKFLPLGMEIGAVMEEAVGEGVADSVVEQMRRFVVAADESLFGPVVEVLADAELGNSLRAVASEDVILWARGIAEGSGLEGWGLERRERAERMFRFCVAAVAKSPSSVHDGISGLQRDLLEKGRVSKLERHEIRDRALRRHGVVMRDDDICGVGMGEYAIQNESCNAGIVA